MIRFPLLTVGLAVAIAAVPSAAGAQQDAITIQEGSIVWGSNIPIIDLKGTRSFRLTGVFVPNASVHLEFLSCLVCFPGETVEFGHHYRSGDLART